MKFYLTGFILFNSLFINAQNIGIGTNSPHPSAQLEVSSTSSGFLPPRMTFTQRNSISNPTAGLIIYCTDCGDDGQLQVFNGRFWNGLSNETSELPKRFHSCGTDSVHNNVLNYGTLIDQDANTYKTIKIGTQTWMAENLKTRRYRNGNIIPLVTNIPTWGSLTTGASCWQFNDSSLSNCPYGMLYNWYAVSDSRGLCPTGWHVPSDDEFSTLTTFLGGENIAGGKIKSTSPLWANPNVGADNSSGFSGLPGGILNFNLFFGAPTLYAFWWTSTEFSTSRAWNRYLFRDDSLITRSNYPMDHGLSVRCVKD
jgi:uncharacterized protein (TIGR02145 family)